MQSSCCALEQADAEGVLQLQQSARDRLLWHTPQARPSRDAARIDDRTGSPPRFMPGDAPPVPTLATGPDDDLPPIPALDEASGPLARLFLVERSTGTSDLLAQFHHVACDGLGALAFLADFCALLDAVLRNAAAGLAPPDPSTLRRRGRYGLDSWKLVRSLPAQSRGLEGVWKFLRHRPARLARAWRYISPS